MRPFGKPCRVGLVALVALTSSAAAVRADVLDVPAEHPTIQAAIVAAAAGDTVLVATGTYLETIDFLGKAITVQSSGGAAVTIIDGGGAGSVVTFEGGETNASILQGFTVTGGTGSPWGIDDYIAGGGVRIVHSSPILRDCVITGNTAAAYGGGVFAVDSAGPVFENCTLSSNSTTTIGLGGAGLAADWYSSAMLSGCTLSGNVSAGRGGGFLVDHGTVIGLTNCVVQDNTAVQSGGGGDFATLNTVFEVFTMNDCTVSGNSAAWGGGLSISLQGEGILSPSAAIRRCRFTGNHATNVGGGVSAGTSPGFGGGFARLIDCLISENTAQLGGGVTANNNVRLYSCTVVGNSAAVGGGLLANSLGAGFGPSHCIFWGNGNDQMAGDSLAPEWCDIQGGYAGVGNIDVAPYFVAPASGDFHLAPTSACVDAGNPTYSPANEFDIDGDPRVLFGHIDIGADEATFPAGPWTFLGHALAGAGGAPSLAGTGDLTPGSPMTFALQDALPDTSTWIVLGTGSLLLPFKGGVMVPTIDMLIGPIGSGSGGSYTLGGTWPMAVPPGFVVRLQTWIADASGPAGFTASNGLAAESQ